MMRFGGKSTWLTIFCLHSQTHLEPQALLLRLFLWIDNTGHVCNRISWLFVCWLMLASDSNVWVCWLLFHEYNALKEHVTNISAVITISLRASYCFLYTTIDFLQTDVTGQWRESWVDFYPVQSHTPHVYMTSYDPATKSYSTSFLSDYQEVATVVSTTLKSNLKG